MSFFSRDRDYDITILDTTGRRIGSPVFCNARPAIGESVTVRGATRRVVDVVIDYEAMGRATQHQGTKVPVKVVVE